MKQIPAPLSSPSHHVFIIHQAAHGSTLKQKAYLISPLPVVKQMQEGVATLTEKAGGQSS